MVSGWNRFADQILFDVELPNAREASQFPHEIGEGKCGLDPPGERVHVNTQRDGFPSAIVHHANRSGLTRATNRGGRVL